MFIRYVFSLFNRVLPVLNGPRVREIGRDARTARLAVAAAALALAGLVLAAWARWSAAGVVDEARVEATAAAERLAALVTTATTATRTRAEELAETPAVREILYTDEATARAEGFALPAVSPTLDETLEVVALGRRRAPRSLYRAPATAAALAIARAGEARVEERGGALTVIVSVPAQPMYARDGVRGAVALATRVDLTPLEMSLDASGLAVAIIGAGAPIALTRAAPGNGAGGQMVTVALPPLGEARLSLRAEVRTSGGAALWAGRALLVAAFAAALVTFAAFRRRAPPSLDDAPTAPQHARLPEYGTAQPNAPTMLPTMTTVRGKRAEHARFDDGDAAALAAAWSAPMPTPITQLTPAHESAPILVDPRGERLASRYRLLRPLGRGHAADVYLAQSLLPGAPGTVALKIFNAPDSSERRAFLEAARRQQEIDDAHVVSVLDVGEGDPAYVAMEYVEGCTLALLERDLFARDEPLPLGESVAIVAAVCRALEAAAPLVHGAIKPSNVLVGRHHAVKLADFGAPPSRSHRFAPEQYAGKPADRRSDVYAVGVLLHELLTGRRHDAAAGDDAGRWPPLPAPSTIRPELPRALDALVGKATRFGPRGRYVSAGELLLALDAAARSAAAMMPAVRLGDWVERVRRS